MANRNVLIVNFNTPEMVEAAILSLRKHGGEAYEVTVFDNSDSRPFTKKMQRVSVLDNSLGQLIDLDAEIRKFPERSRRMGNAHVGDFPSVRHMLSVQWYMDHFDGEGFLLMDSDILIRTNVDFMFWEGQCAVGHVQTWERAGNPGQKDRLVPILCYIGVKKCKECGVRYFDPDRTFALHKDGEANAENWYDTGSSFLYEIRSHKNGACGKGIDIRELMFHYGSASWQRTGLQAQLEWLEQHKECWKPEDDYTLGDPKCKRPLNKTAKIFVCAHSDFEQQVTNPVYELVDARTEGDEVNGIPGAFYSELLQKKRVIDRGKLPSIVGFCQYRKYFHWLDNVPDLNKWVKRYGCLVSQAKDLGMSVYDHYKDVGNVKDIDIATDIIRKKWPMFEEAWEKSLESHLLHPCSMFIMKSKDVKMMVNTIWSIVNDYMDIIGGDIDKRICDMPEAYHIPHHSIEYQRRVGGQLCERLVSAWIDWWYPEAKEIPIVFTGKPQ